VIRRYSNWTVERRLGVAVAASLAVHAAAMSLSLPAPRVSLLEPPQVLEVYLREAAAPPTAAPAPASLAPAAPAAEKRARPERRSHEPRTLARKSEPAAPPLPETVEEERAPAPALETSITPQAPAVQPPSAPLAVHAALPRVSRSELLSGYGQTISRTLARYKEYPRIAQMQGWQGAVTMRLRVAPSGHLIDAEVHASSGHEALDRQALAMAAKPERFPPPPEGLLESEIAVLVPVIFRLER
jgi:periplasmic protein TonB